MTLRIAALAFLSFCPVLPAETAAPKVATEQAQAHHDFCRYLGDDRRGKLETSILTMKNAAGVSVDLIGAIHIADAGYYHQLNDIFKGYDALLFELVDGQNLKERLEEKGAKKNAKPATTDKKPEKAGAHEADDEIPHGRPPRRAKDDVALKIISGMMTGVGSFLRLSYQTDEVDYQAKNFVHADVSYDEFHRLQEEKGESWLQLFQKSIEGQLKRGRKKDEEPKPSAMLLALLGDSSGVKVGMARMLSSLEGQGEEIGFGSDSVIVGERNRVALEIFDREVKAGRKNLGIFYGAAHLKDMRDRLEKRGYKPVSERWLTAWDIKPLSDDKKTDGK